MNELVFHSRVRIDLINMPIEMCATTYIGEVQYDFRRLIHSEDEIGLFKRLATEALARTEKKLL